MQSYTLEEPSEALLNYTLNERGDNPTGSTSVSDCRPASATASSEQSNTHPHSTMLQLQATQGHSIVNARCTTQEDIIMQKYLIASEESMTLQRSVLKECAVEKLEMCVSKAKFHHKSVRHTSKAESTKTDSPNFKTKIPTPKLMHSLLSKCQLDTPPSFLSEQSPKEGSQVKGNIRTPLGAAKHRQLLKLLGSPQSLQMRSLTPAPPSRALTPTPPTERPRSEMGTRSSRSRLERKNLASAKGISSFCLVDCKLRKPRPNLLSHQILLF